VTIDIIRRDTLAAAQQVPSPLMGTRPRPLAAISDHQPAAPRQQ
jgi:hypothetical protein